MKILHTSDWHLGQILYGYDRSEETQHLFTELKEIALNENPDVFIVSGDIFDVSVPSTATVKQFNDFILDLNDNLGKMTIIVTSGNHDSASKIDVNRNLWRKAGIHVIGSIRKNNGKYCFDDNIISIPDKGYVLAIPYVNRAFMAPRNETKSQEKQFFDEAAQAIADKKASCLPCVLMAHIAVENCDMKCHRFAQTGNIDVVTLDTFNPIYDYVALGHIHKPQTLDPKGRIRYCGSPMQIGFDEDFPHSVTIAEVNYGEDVKIKEIMISPLRKLKTIPEVAVEFDTALKILRKLPSDDRSYIRLNVSQDKDLPYDCQEKASEATKEKECRFCMIKVSKRNSDNPSAQDNKLSAEQFIEMSPKDVANKFFTDKSISIELQDEYEDLLNEIIDSIDNQLYN